MEQLVSTIVPIMLGAVLVEAVVTAITAVVDAVRAGTFAASYKPLVALVIGVGVGVLYGLDLFAGVGLQTQVPYVGAVLSGIILSRGANYVYDVIASLNAYRKKTEGALQ